MDWLKAARVFERIVESRNLSLAGRRLGMSSASVSRHLSSLEDELGARLVNRTSRNLSLTEAGEVYYAQVSAILKQIDLANETIGELNAEPKGTLRIHSRIVVGQLLICPVLPRFGKAYPGLKVDLSLSNFASDIIDSGVDIDIRVGKLLDSSLTCRKLLSSQRMVCATAEYLETHPVPRHPSDLADHNCLTHRLDQANTIWKFRPKAGGDDLEVPVSGSLQTDFGMATIALLYSGVGIGLVPDWLAARDVASGRLIQLFPDYLVSHIDFENDIYAVYQRARNMSPKIHAFVTFFVDAIKANIGRLSAESMFSTERLFPPE